MVALLATLVAFPLLHLSTGDVSSVIALQASDAALAPRPAKLSKSVACIATLVQLACLDVCAAKLSRVIALQASDAALRALPAQQ